MGVDLEAELEVVPGIGLSAAWGRRSLPPAMLTRNVPRLLGIVLAIGCLATGCLPPGRSPASFVALLRDNGLAFEPGAPPADVIGASEVIRFPGQTGPPTYGVLSCLRPACLLVSGPGEQLSVWLAVFPGVLADDGLGWALIDAHDNRVIASSK